jgi:hypothetical protein
MIEYIYFKNKKKNLYFRKSYMAQQKQLVKSRFSFNDVAINSIAGATSGVFVSVLVSPLDVIKTRIQVKRLPKGVPDTTLFVVMYRLGQREGFRAFYKGIGATMLVRYLFFHINNIILMKF